MSTEITTVRQSFDIPSFRLGEFTARMAKLTKRATKIGSGSIGFEVVGTYTKKVNRCITQGITIVGVRPMVCQYTKVVVWGPRPKFEGWMLMGRLDFATAPGQMLRMMVPGIECPTEFYTVDSQRCDHCKTRRARNDSFLVQHDDGRILVVGRQCIGDFLGHESPEQIAQMMAVLSDIRLAGEEGESWGRGGAPEAWSAAEIFTLASYSIRSGGWARSQEDGSTRNDVLGLLTHKIDPKAEAERQARLAEVTERDVDRGNEITEWCLALDGSSDYLANLKAVAAAGVTFKSMGLAVSAVVAFDRAQEREVARKREMERRVAQPSTHVGTVGERIELDGEITFVRHTESQWGTTTIVKFMDASGNVFTWFASGGRELESGTKVHVRGTVKKHDAYKGEAQTVLTRCKVTEAQNESAA